MATSPTNISWNRKSLSNAIHKKFQENSVRQIKLHIGWERINYTDKTKHNKICIATFGSNRDCFEISPDGMKILGQAILDLSKMDNYDRIIEVTMYEEHRIILDWMLPLFSDEFTSLIAIYGLFSFDNIRPNGIRCASTYNTLCDMISRDKIIVVPLALLTSNSEIYDIKKRKFLVDESKLMNAIKSTNTLKEIVLVNTYCDDASGAKYFYVEFEQLLKEALSLNYSVTSLASHEYNEDDAFDLAASYPPNKHGSFYSNDYYKMSEETFNKYHEWWPLVQKRNEESQLFNKILAGDEKDDGTWNNQKCPYQVASKLLKRDFSVVPSLFFDKKGDRCFCMKCHTKRKDKMTYKRGKPPKLYGLPVEWVRFGLKTDEAKCLMNNIWTKWHVAFHGTMKDIIPQIFKAGLVLLRAGDVTINGDELGVRGGHIQKPFERYNKYSKQNETFNPNQIYLSPSIKYSGHGAYAKWYYCTHPDDNNRTIKVQCAFQVRVRPGSYNIGQETVGAARTGVTLDKHFSNNELEWYTKENVGILLHGLLFHIKEVNVPLKQLKKKHYDDEKKEED
eukprot:263510_1